MIILNKNDIDKSLVRSSHGRSTFCPQEHMHSAMVREYIRVRNFFMWVVLNMSK